MKMLVISFGYAILFRHMEASSMVNNIMIVTKCIKSFLKNFKSILSVKDLGDDVMVRFDLGNEVLYGVKDLRLIFEEI